MWCACVFISQEYVKPNPAIAEKNKVNGSLLALEKSFHLERKAEERRKQEQAKGPDLTWRYPNMLQTI